MNEYWLYFFFTLSNAPLYYLLIMAFTERNKLQSEVHQLYQLLLEQRKERRYSDMEEGNSDDLEHAEKEDIVLEEEAEEGEEKTENKEKKE